MTHIELRGVEKRFGDLHVIHTLDLTIADGEFIVMLGPSGCGKTTTLRAIAGLETIDEGDILIDGAPVQHLKAADRDIAFVFQSFSLYPHMTVFENIAFPLRATRMARAEVDAAVRRVADVLRIGPLLGKRPSALSGGDMQRVAIGRALVRRPKAMLMDEPIGALDAKLREAMRTEIKRLHLAQGSTTIYVTHDQVEAMSLADRIVIMNEGELQQVGSPDEVYEEPANLFVAQFVGSPVMNVAQADVRGEDGAARVMLGGAGFPFPPELLARLNGARDRRLALGIRPEGVLVERAARDGYLPVEAHIIEPLGSHDIVDLKIGDGFLRARTASGYVGRPGERVFVRLDPAQAHFFDAASGDSLGIRL
jgi:multiple sugar transport system ATP-binding protein